MSIGSSDSKQAEHARVEPATTQPSPLGRRGVDVVAHMATKLIASDSVLIGTSVSITGSSGAVRAGDLIQFTAGDLADMTFVVQEALGSMATLAQELPEVPDLGDTYDILRYSPMRLSTSSSIETAETVYALQYDDTEAGGITYVGEALPGAVTSSAVWRIKRLTETGPDMVVEWADGDSDFNNIWDDRASLSYS